MLKVGAFLYIFPYFFMQQNVKHQHQPAVSMKYANCMQHILFTLLYIYFKNLHINFQLVFYSSLTLDTLTTHFTHTHSSNEREIFIHLLFSSFLFRYEIFCFMK